MVVGNNLVCLTYILVIKLFQDFFPFRFFLTHFPFLNHLHVLWTVILSVLWYYLSSLYFSRLLFSMFTKDNLYNLHILTTHLFVMAVCSVSRICLYIFCLFFTSFHTMLIRYEGICVTDVQSVVIIVAWLHNNTFSCFPIRILITSYLHI